MLIPRTQTREKPLPLENAPVRAVLERHRGEAYTVCIDESFYRFLDFRDLEGNFCYGAVGFPTAALPSITAALQPWMRRYQEVVSASAATFVEFKSAQLRRCEVGFRRQFLLKLRTILSAHGGFIASFYTSVRGLAVESLRVELMDDSEALPDNFQERLPPVLDNLRQCNRAMLIGALVHLPSSSMLSMLGSFQCPFTLLVDPRETTENLLVEADINDYLRKLTATVNKEHAGLFQGIDCQTTSYVHLGLQLADLIVGEARAWYREHHDLLQYGSSTRLITPTSEDHYEQLGELNGLWFKEGRLTPMPRAVIRRLHRASPHSGLGYFFPILAAGTLSYYTDNGEQRLIRISEAEFFDLCD